MNQARAIVWAQWRIFRNFYPRGGSVLATAIFIVWYTLWAVGATAIARAVANPGFVAGVHAGLPIGFLVVFFYWQVVPVLIAATGASLDLKKLQAYPIPTRQMFMIEVLLRSTASLEMFIILLGAAVGILANPLLRNTGVLAIVLYVVFNLCLAVGIRDLLNRLLARRRFRELVFVVFFLAMGLFQVVAVKGARYIRGDSLPAKIILSPAWPWTAAARSTETPSAALSIAILLAWCLAALAFGLWQFSKSLAFDEQAAGAAARKQNGGRGWLENFYRLPAVLFNDPLGSLIEKDFRTLPRSPRFRTVFLMGFTFGILLLFPVAFGRAGAPRSFFATNYLTMASLYSLLLLSEVSLWNAFGFDRSATQIYFLAPIPFQKVLIAKNITAVAFIFLEFSAVAIVCAVLRMPMSGPKIGEAFAVIASTSVFQFAAGNWMSVREARCVNPDSSMRSSAPARVQGLLLLAQPIALIPCALAYLARFAFDTEWAFFAVLAVTAGVGLIVYRIALESAVEYAEREKEKMLTALSAGSGPIG